MRIMTYVFEDGTMTTSYEEAKKSGKTFKLEMRTPIAKKVELSPARKALLRSLA